ncbi:MAG: geranylgeranylglyceryl/heptaprenylglyceryl phosphate synthase [Candidatus Neomarinimicrobiota bacterium]|nr:MAG: geranylgeranylglyceryl/heptaprenylglyceryl phosphate synthase [Candidatus Neomarinimicrobiota bacterium]
MSTVHDYLSQVRRDRGAGYLVLIDPDRKNDGTLEARVEAANASGVDALLVGGSLMMDGKSHARVKRIKEAARMPVIFFPGSLSQLCPHYDAMLFLSVISGRNPHYLIGEQVIAAPVIRDLGLETMATGYVLLDGGAHSTVEFMSGSTPIPMNRPDIVVAHGLAAQYLGMHYLYLEAGSGAREPVSTTVIRAVKAECDLPLIVGGGIRTPEAARERVKAGADFVVTGTVLEEAVDLGLMGTFAKAVHWKERT